MVLVMALLIAPRDAKPGCPVLAPGLRERSPMATLAFSWYEQSPPALTQSPNALVNPVITGDLGDRELL
jgi:hypothetical protein